MPCPWDIKTGKNERYISIQVALYWELVRNGTADGLSFEPEKHIFTVEGKRLPSVTGFLRAEGIIPDLGFVTDYHLLRGSFVHRATELFDLGTLDEETIDDEIRPYLDCYKAFLADYQGKILHIEKKLYHPIYRYAGIVDRVSDDKDCHILFLHPKKSRPYTFEMVGNIRSHLNVGLSALNIFIWKNTQFKEE